MSKIDVHNAELLQDTGCQLGEGPVWDYKKKCLYWVDIEGYKLHLYQPVSGKNNVWTFDEMIGAAVPTESENLLLAMEKGLATFNPKTERLVKLGVLENSDTALRFNDGKVGPDGAFWVGTMEKNCAPNAGNFFRVAPGLQSKLIIPKTSVSNGMAWTSDKKTFYYIDSPTFQIRAFDFDLKNGSLMNVRTVIEVPADYGSPDGMCIDTEEMLWVAHWGGHCVRRWNPKTGEEITKINVPAPHVTSCCFGGEDLKTLFITTARSGLSNKQLEEFPLSGGIFQHHLEAQGQSIYYFNDQLLPS